MDRTRIVNKHSCGDEVPEMIRALGSAVSLCEVPSLRFIDNDME